MSPLGVALLHWRKQYPSAKLIVGIDIDPKCKELARPDLGIHVEIGSQCDTTFLRDIVKRYGIPQMVLDDGGHRPHQQVASFRALFPSLEDGSVYAIEDLQMSGKLRWRCWSLLFPSVTSILTQLYWRQNAYVPDGQSLKGPKAMHLYPHIVFVEAGEIKTWVSYENSEL